MTPADKAAAWRELADESEAYARRLPASPKREYMLTTSVPAMRTRARNIERRGKVRNAPPYPEMP